ncbi:cytochrome P450 [Peniophora sp. CONT]|nr:cytochrome P450 [Peniophora sp. CONT]
MLLNVSAGAFLAAVPALAFLLLWRRCSSHLLPGPKPRFFTGNIHQIPRSEAWKTYMEWSKQYGPVFLLRIFNQSIIVLNSHHAVTDLLESRSSIYSDRPMLWMYKVLVDRQWAIFNISDHHPRFKIYRRILQSALNPKAIQDYRSLQTREANALLRRLHERPTDFATHLRRNAGTVILELAYGWTVQGDSDPFVKLIEDGFKVQAALVRPGAYYVEIFPWLRFVPTWFPGANFKRQAQEYKILFQGIDRVPHDWAMKRINSGTYIDSFTSRNMRPQDAPQPDAEMEDIIKWCSSALYAGGADTTVAAMTTFMLCMTLNPDTQQRARDELDRVVGLDRVPTLDDRKNLPYLNALIKEVFRWAPPVPQGLPHMVVQDDHYQGLLIPKGAMVIANIWALMHDPDVYPDPFAFNPERFLGGSFERSQYDPMRYAFGFGRRICPGAHFAEASVFLNVASILSTFSILKPVNDNGKAYDPPYEYTSTITTHPKPFPCRIVLRPHARGLLGLDD